MPYIYYTKDKFRMTEKDLYAKLKRTLPHVDFQRIETMTKSGIPDLSYCFPDGIEGWIELKIGIPLLRPSQVSWHTRAYANHRRAFILTFDPPRITYFLYRSSEFSQINKHFLPLPSSLLVKTKNLDDVSPYLTYTY